MSKRTPRVTCPQFFHRIRPEEPPYPAHPDEILDELEERFWALDRLAYGTLLALETDNENDAVGEHVMGTEVSHAIWHHARDLRNAATAIRAWIEYDRNRRGAA